MGASAVEEAIVTFLNLFGKEQMSHAILNENSGSGIRYVQCIQGDPSDWFLAFVDIKTKVLSLYRLLILKCNFLFDINKKASNQPNGSPCIDEEYPSYRAIEKFLGILEFVIKEPGASFRKFVPSTLSLCMNDIYPLVANVSVNSDIGPCVPLRELFEGEHYYRVTLVVEYLGWVD